MTLEELGEIARIGGVVTGEKLDFDLTGMNLAAVVFEDVDFTGSILQQTDFSECVFTDCRFTASAFVKTDLRFAIFNKCVATSCQFDSIQAFSTQFVETDFTDSRFSGQCEQSTFKDCILENSVIAFDVNRNNTIAGCKMRGAVFQGDLDQLTLFRLDLSESHFDSQHLRQVVFFESQAVGIDLQGKNLTGSQFIDADLTGVNFSQSDLTQCSLKGCALQQAVFLRTEAPNALFPEADLSGADFRESNLTQTIWVGAVLNEADLSRTRLSMSVFQRAQCLETVFDEADLEYADFSYATLVGSQFRGAKFNRTNMHRAVAGNDNLKQQQGVTEKDEALYEAELFSAHLDG